MDFRKMDVQVTLTGEQWFALMAKVAGKPLSDEGRGIARAAMNRLGEQVVSASETAPEVRPSLDPSDLRGEAADYA